MTSPPTEASYVQIHASENDEEFRRVTKNLLDSATSEILIITGEIGASFFPELRQSAFGALKRGVRMRVYATSPGQELADDLASKGVELRIGPPTTKDHFMVVDRKAYIVSEKETIGPTMVGTRHGRLYLNNPEGANQIAELFEADVQPTRTLSVLADSKNSRLAENRGLIPNMLVRWHEFWMHKNVILSIFISLLVTVLLAVSIFTNATSFLATVALLLFASLGLGTFFAHAD